MILAATGHRPNKLGGYDTDVMERLIALAAGAFFKYQPSAVISGMALGWDTAIAIAALNLNIPLIAAIPFKGQQSRWPRTSQEHYHALVEKAYDVHVVCNGGYAPWKMQTRNEWMVDKSDVLLALWDGSSGGTGNCIEYARRTSRRIINVWPSWVKYKGVKS